VPIHAVGLDVPCDIVPALHTLKSKYCARISIAEEIGGFPNLLLGSRGVTNITYCKSSA
jgi:hypothetical protein